MNKRIDIPAELYEDEAVCFIADCYHTTSENVVQCFFAQDGIVPESAGLKTFCLENNEMEILRGLIYHCHL